MSLENKIELLTQAIIELTERMGPPTETDKIIAEKLDEVSDQIITSEQVKELAKKKMSEGVKRTTIKELIIELKAEAIADLDEKGLATLYQKLEELK